MFTDQQKQITSLTKEDVLSPYARIFDNSHYIDKVPYPNILGPTGLPTTWTSHTSLAHTRISTIIRRPSRHPHIPGSLLEAILWTTHTLLHFKHTLDNISMWNWSENWGDIRSSEVNIQHRLPRFWFELGRLKDDSVVVLHPHHPLHTWQQMPFIKRKRTLFSSLEPQSLEDLPLSYPNVKLPLLLQPYPEEQAQLEAAL